MEVVGITTLVAKFIETDEDNYPYYRRGGPEQWENLMGESWESYYDDGSLEAAYQAFKKEQIEAPEREASDASIDSDPPLGLYLNDFRIECDGGLCKEAT